MHNAVSDHIYRPSGLKHYLFVLTLSPMVFTLKMVIKKLVKKVAAFFFLQPSIKIIVAKKIFLIALLSFKRIR